MTAATTPMHTFAGGGTVPLPIKYSLGLDLGKMSDPTALALVEQRPERVIEHFNRMTIAPVWGDDPRHGVTWLQRWPLRTPYHQIAAFVARLVANLVARPRAEVTLFVDGTGVGTAVVEILEKEPTIKALGLTAITITSGRAVTRVAGGWHVAKGELIAPAQVALQRGMLDISPQLPDARTLDRELRDFTVTLTDAAHATFEHREGQHDDLVLGVALAVWGAAHPKVDNTVHMNTYRGTRVIAPYGSGVRPYGQRRY